jgi:hypothetical protein
MVRHDAKTRFLSIIWLEFFLTVVGGFSSNYKGNQRIINPLRFNAQTDDKSHYYGTKETFSETFSLLKTRKRRRSLRNRTREEVVSFTYKYNYDVLQVLGEDTNTKNDVTGVILIHPIGVGISKWFYDRLNESFADTNVSSTLYLITPDLLGSGSAVCLPAPPENVKPSIIPLFNISDWSDQITELMSTMEEKYPDINQWCLVANGGCSPIALQVAQRSVEGTSATFQCPVSTIILSSVPRPQFFLEASDPKKVAKAYKRLCGPVGNAFWWYSCRNEGAFIQKFSEKNLVADPANLGDQWRMNCFQMASQNKGQSKYSTFAFLAGTLQDGCVASLNALKEHRDEIRVHVVKGRDTRTNRAKSWFWQKRKLKKQQGLQTTFRDYLEENGLGGKETLIGGRISLAHEDAQGYRDAILSFLS